MKKTLEIIKNVLVWLLVVFAVGMMIFTVISVNTFDQANRSVFGYKFFVVSSDSMSATDFDAGDIVFVKNVDPTTLREGDIIAFTSQNSNNYGQTVTHKIRKLVTAPGGDPGFVTYGTTTDTDDEAVVTYSYVLGKYTGRVPGVGSFFLFLKTTPGYILCIFVPFLLLILYQGLCCIQLFRRYKKEQMEEIAAQRAQIEEERRQAAQMMAELQALKEQLAASGVQAKEE
ncbi:MAG: signal peptidase I [Oscillospiraceae bacterium]|nr:signal peptidase I [Oscillospiraceae bacterium]